MVTGQQLVADADVEVPTTFHLMRDVLPPGGVQLANGVTVTPGDWMTLLIARIGTEGTGSCTATLVGPEAILTAAHCVDRGLLGGVRPTRVRIDGYDLELTCTMHPDYAAAPPKVRSPRSSQDYSLCRLVIPNTRPPTLQRLTYETLDVDRVLAVGEPVLLTGFGCTDLWVRDGELGFNPADRVLRVGEEIIAGGTQEAGPEADYVSTLSELDREPAICPGDSGGPLISGATVRDQVGSRRVRGVNSSIAAEINGSAYDYRSRMSALATPRFRRFARQWIADNDGATICGVNVVAGDQGCRP